MGWTAPLVAQDEGGCDQKVASVLYKQGSSFYANGQFDPALSSFAIAYDTCAYPVFLQAMSACQAKLGQVDEAISSARRALWLHKERGNVIGGLSQAEASGTQASILAWQMRQEATRISQGLWSYPAGPLPYDDGADLSAPLPRILGWSMVGLGAAGLIGSGVTAIMLDDRLEEAERATMDDSPQALSQAKDDAATLQTVGKVTLFGGAGLLFGGIATLLFYPETPATALHLHLHPEHVGAEWLVRF